MTSSSSATTSTTRQIHPNKLNFSEGVNLIFDSWTALRLAVQMDFAGEDTLEKAQWIRKVMVEHFDSEGKKVEPEDLEDILLEVMAREFHVNLEDFSEQEIARLLYDLYRECIRGDVTMLTNLRMKAEARKSKTDSVEQSQGIDNVEEVDHCFLDPEYIDNDDEISDEDEDMDTD